jgi:hypothetical protein
MLIYSEINKLCETKNKQTKIRSILGTLYLLTLSISQRMQFINQITLEVQFNI